MGKGVRLTEHDGSCGPGLDDRAIGGRDLEGFQHHGQTANFFHRDAAKKVVQRNRGIRDGRHHLDPKRIGEVVEDSLFVEGTIDLEKLAEMTMDFVP